MIIQGKVWGHTSPLFNKNNTELHLVHINKGGFCSRHLHKFKFNKFVVINGKLKVTIWKDYGSTTLEDVSIVNASQECTVPPGYYHKFEALEDTLALEVYWVELNDDDIVRADHGGIYEAKTDIATQANAELRQPKEPCDCGKSHCIECYTRENRAHELINRLKRETRHSPPAVFYESER